MGGVSHCIRRPVGRRAIDHFHDLPRVNELICIGINHKAFDQRVCYGFWHGILVRAQTEGAEIIKHARELANGAHTYDHIFERKRAVAETGPREMAEVAAPAPYLLGEWQDVLCIGVKSVVLLALIITNVIWYVTTSHAQTSVPNCATDPSTATGPCLLAGKAGLFLCRATRDIP
jgi:hypothetical protein